MSSASQLSGIKSLGNVHLWVMNCEVVFWLYVLGFCVFFGMEGTSPCSASILNEIHRSEKLRPRFFRILILLAVWVRSSVTSNSIMQSTISSSLRRRSSCRVPLPTMKKKMPLSPRICAARSCRNWMTLDESIRVKSGAVESRNTLYDFWFTWFIAVDMAVPSSQSENACFAEYFSWLVLPAVDE